MQFSSVFTQAVVALFIAQAAAAPLTDHASVQRRAGRCMAIGCGKKLPDALIQKLISEESRKGRIRPIVKRDAYEAAEE